MKAARLAVVFALLIGKWIVAEIANGEQENQAQKYCQVARSQKRDSGLHSIKSPLVSEIPSS